MSCYIDYFPKFAGGSFKPVGPDGIFVKGIDSLYQPQLDMARQRAEELIQQYSEKNLSLEYEAKQLRLRLKADTKSDLEFFASEQLELPFDPREVVHTAP